MATAPEPGARRRADQTAEFKRAGLKITLAGETRELYLAALGPADDLVARREVGFPISPFVERGTFGADSVLVLWWMARRKNGEPGLRFADVLEQFPSYAALAAADPEIEELDDDEHELEVAVGSSPEG